MPVKNFFFVLFFLSTLIDGVGQSPFQLMGQSDAVVLDMRIDKKEKYLVALTDKDIQLWDLSTNMLEHSWPAESVHSIDLHDELLAGVSTGGQLIVWDIENGDKKTYAVATSPLTCVQWVDSLSVVVGSEDGTIYKVISTSGEIVARAHTLGYVTALSGGVSHTVLAGSDKGELEFFDASTLRRTNSIKAHKTWIREIQAVDSNRYFISISDDNKMKRWRPEGAAVIESTFPGSWSISADHFSDTQNPLTAVGKLNGNIIVRTAFGTYSSKAQAIINKIFLIRRELPLIRVIVATHGAGLQIWDGNDMKLRPR